MINGRTALLALLTSSCTCSSNSAEDGGTDAVNDTAAPPEDGGQTDVEADVSVIDPCAAAAALGNVIGCDYVAISPPRYYGALPYGCLAVVVINPTNNLAHVSATFQSKPQNLAYHANAIVGQGRGVTYSAIPSGDQIAPHSAVVISLGQGIIDQDDTPCPIPPVVDMSQEYEVTAQPNGTASAFRIQTSIPTIVYDVWPFTRNDIDVQNIVPLRAVPSWVQSYVDVGTYVPTSSLAWLSWTLGLADTVGTSISMPSADAGIISASLNAYELLNVARQDQFIGQVVATNKAFALWTGSVGVRVPDGPYQDIPTSNQPFFEIPQVTDWGHTYAFAKQDNRTSVNERTFFRIVAATDGTILTYSPSQPSGAPSSIDRDSANLFFSYDPFVVSSQDAAHPIFVMAHMVDAYDFDPTRDAGGANEGSNAMHAVPPVEQWGKRYDVFMPYNYPSSQLVVVRAIGGSDVTADCAGIVTGWQSIDGSYEYARVWISKDTNGVFNPQLYAAGTCDNGVHAITSDGPFGLTVYGWISTPFATYSSMPPPQIDIGSSYAYAPLTAHATIVNTDGGAH